ncbi:hypothetical protein VTK73DRAFT_3781 [Phialemonium thermophilum]|uniref:Uncharacterized protein n=1 Tax=Phialemonium thermophilum TaxID=223376 RepID=A0ABR3VF24_9PEZI
MHQVVFCRLFPFYAIDISSLHATQTGNRLGHQQHPSGKARVMGRRTLPPALSVFVRLAAWLSLAGVGWSQTTAPVFLPGYDESDWTALRGSIVASDESMTTYTIFCAQQTPPSCLLDDALPFSFAEGSSSLRFSGTMKGQM